MHLGESGGHTRLHKLAQDPCDLPFWRHGFPSRPSPVRSLVGNQGDDAAICTCASIFMSVSILGSKKLLLAAAYFPFQRDDSISINQTFS